MSNLEVQAKGAMFFNMVNLAKDKSYLNASDFAKLCNVDLKTVHNWVGKHQIEHFRTPGRHLRFRRNVVRRFLVEHGFDVPKWLEPQQSEVACGTMDST